MTAALVAAGITPDEFLAVADADETTDAITEGTGGTKKGLLARAMRNKVTTGDGSPVTDPARRAEGAARSKYAGAADAVTFRERVAEMIVKLQAGAKTAAAKGRASDALQDKDVSMALDELDKLAGAEVEFQGYVGRELNKEPDLDLMLEAARRIQRSGSGKKSPTIAAADVVAEGLRAHTFADNILKQLVYRKIKQEPKGGAGILTLFTIEQLLLTAKKPGDVNQAIDLGVKHFRNKVDHRITKRGHRKFAQQLDQRRMRGRLNP